MLAPPPPIGPSPDEGSVGNGGPDGFRGVLPNLVHVDVRIDADCDNAPRKAQIRDWLIAMARADSDDVRRLLSEDVTWESVGSQSTTDRSQLLTALPREPAKSLVVSNLLSHGKHVAAEGLTTLADGRRERFAYFFTFTGHGKSALIESVTRFAITS